MVTNSKCVYLNLALFASAFCFLISCSGNNSSAESDSSVGVADSNKTTARLNYGECSSLLADAKKWDSVLHSEIEVKKDIAAKAMAAFTSYAYFCGQDSLSPVFLIKTAQVARSVNNLQQAEVALQHCVKEYPDFKDRPAAIFLLAQLFDEDSHMNDERKAKEYYEQIIKEYPRSVWAENAKGALTFLGKTDEQVMEQLKKQNR